MESTIWLSEPYIGLQYCIFCMAWHHTSDVLKEVRSELADCVGVTGHHTIICGVGGDRAGCVVYGAY